MGEGAEGHSVPDVSLVPYLMGGVCWHWRFIGSVWGDENRRVGHGVPESCLCPS